ncbi:hypothetical protein DSECCO2_511230 [anaerobic digester metagenome]
MWAGASEGCRGRGREDRRTAQAVRVAELGPVHQLLEGPVVRAVEGQPGPGRRGHAADQAAIDRRAGIGVAGAAQRAVPAPTRRQLRRAFRAQGMVARLIQHRRAKLAAAAGKAGQGVQEAPGRDRKAAYHPLLPASSRTACKASRLAEKSPASSMPRSRAVPSRRKSRASRK